MATKCTMRVVGTGTIGEQLLGLLLPTQRALAVEEITLHKHSLRLLSSRKTHGGRQPLLAMLVAIFFALLSLEQGAAASPSPWAMYGHDSAHTGRSIANGPSSPNLVWTYPLGVSATDNASPVIGPDGAIYVPSQTALFAVNPDGTLKWKKWGTSWSDEADIRLTPAVAADGTVYVTAQAALDDPQWPSHLLYALRPTDGEALWSYNIGRATYGSPTLGADGTIYIGSASDPSSLYALNPDGTLKFRWNSGSSCWIESSVAIGPNGDLYFHHNCLGLVALDANGQLQWTYSGLGEAFNSSSVGPDGTIYIGDTIGFHALNPNEIGKWQ